MTYVAFVLPIALSFAARSGMNGVCGISAGAFVGFDEAVQLPAFTPVPNGAMQTRSLFGVSSRKWFAMRWRAYARTDQRLLICCDVPMRYSFICGGLTPGTNSLPAEERVGSTPNRLPFASKYAVRVFWSWRSHDAARASELAAGL